MRDESDRIFSSFILLTSSFRSLQVLFAPADMLAHDVEQAARLLDMQVGVEVDAEDALPTPMPALRPAAGVDDHALEGRPSQQLLDELLGAEELEIARLHASASM